MPPVPESTTFCSHRNQLSESLKVKKTLWFHFTHRMYFSNSGDPKLYSRNIIYVSVISMNSLNIYDGKIKTVLPVFPERHLFNKQDVVCMP